MKKVYNSAVVIIPPKDKWEPIQEIRRKWDRQINRWMPHIILLFPFRPLEEYDFLLEEFSKICGSINAFEIALKNSKFFEHKRQKYTMWLDPEPNIAIKELQAEILKVVPDCDDVTKHKGGFTPHLSVGQIQGRNNLLKTLKNLQNTWKELSFVVNQISFIWRENKKDSRFEIKKRLNLNN